MNNYIRVSYSLLKKVQQGYIDEAINLMNGFEMPTNEKQELGKKYHKYLEKYAELKRQLPDFIGGDYIKDYKQEVKISKLINHQNWEIEVVGIIDLLSPDNKIADDYKIGSTGLSNYINSWQHKIYAYLIPELELFRYRAYNPYTDELNIGIVKINEKTRKECEEIIINYTQELINQLLFYCNWQKGYSIKNDKLRFYYKG